MTSEEPLDFSIKALKKEQLPESEPTYIFENYPYPAPVMPYFYPPSAFYPISLPRLSYESCSSDHRSEELQATSTSTSSTLYQYKEESELNSTSSSERSYESKSFEVTSTMISPTYTIGNAAHQEDHQIPDVMADVNILAEDPEYVEFETNAFRAMTERNGGSLLGSNPRMRRVVGTNNQTASDGSYRKQREKNNLAAKQSRDRRKRREMQLAFKVTYLSNKLSRLQQVLSTRNCTRCQQRHDTE